MIKKFFVAMILGLLVMSSQIVSAAAVDWDSVPHFGNKAELATYIENGRRKDQTTFYFVFPSAKISNQAEFDDFLGEFVQYIATARDVHLNLVTFKTGRFICTIRQDYPGTRVANAYLSSNQYQAWMHLTPEEQKLYNIAVEIVDEANKRSSELEKARYIHDEICRRVHYKNENERNTTALGLIDGYVQCRGYADAFYMLGRMCDLNVRKINGTRDGSAHMWNWITFKDGKSYFVDVGYRYFLKTREQMEKNYRCKWDVVPNLQ